MIDYDKLKIAHELSHNYYMKFDGQISIEINFLTEFVEYILHIDDSPNDAFSNIDHLIAMLSELAKQKPEHNYELGDKLFVMKYGAPYSFSIIERNFYESSGYFYGDGINVWREEVCYPSYEALIQAQIDYWKNLLSEEQKQDLYNYCAPKVCQHESDGYNYDKDFPHFDVHGVMKVPRFYNKCKKCGEFYQ